MNEQDARYKIKAALDRLRDTRSVANEDRIEEDSSTVDYHIDNILKSGEGQWNETIARDYVQNLEAQIEQEFEAPGSPKA